jgi:hypothetical protein
MWKQATYKSATNMQNQLQLGKRLKEKGNILTANERVVRDVNYSNWKPDEDHIEWWEQKAACIGEAAEVWVFKHMLANGLGRRRDARFPALFELQEIPLADFGVVWTWPEHEVVAKIERRLTGRHGWVLTIRE